MASRKRLEEKKRPGPNFLIQIPLELEIPIRFSTSTLNETYESFKKKVKENKKIMGKILRRYICESMDVNSIEEATKEDIVLAKLVHQIKDRISELVVGEEGVRSFSSLVEEMMIAYNDEHKNKK